MTKPHIVIRDTYFTVQEGEIARDVGMAQLIDGHEMFYIDSEDNKWVISINKKKEDTK